MMNPFLLIVYGSLRAGTKVPFIFFMRMSLCVVSVVHVVLNIIMPSAKCCIAVSAFWSCMPSVRRSR